MTSSCIDFFWSDSDVVVCTKFVQSSRPSHPVLTPNYCLNVPTTFMNAGFNIVFWLICLLPQISIFLPQGRVLCNWYSIWRSDTSLGHQRAHQSISFCSSLPLYISKICTMFPSYVLLCFVSDQSEPHPSELFLGWHQVSEATLMCTGKYITWVHYEYIKTESCPYFMGHTIWPAF